MSVNNKRVFYVKYLANPIYADILRARPDVRLDKLENESADAVAALILSAADRKSTRLNSSHSLTSRMPSSA